MALWQFIGLTVLVGGLLVYASVLTRRLGCTNARLKRIEEALLVKDRPIEHADARATRAQREVTAKEGRVGYLTIRDLKVRNERLSSPATRSSGRSSAAVKENPDTLKTTRVLMSSPGAAPEREDSAAMNMEGREVRRTCSEQVGSPGTRPLDGSSVSTSLENRDAMEAISEPPSSSTMLPVNGDSVATSSQSRDPVETNSESLSSLSARPANGISVATTPESRDALETTSGPESPPGCRLPSEDAVAKKNRDALLILSSQRRRRRAHLGY